MLLIYPNTYNFSLNSGRNSRTFLLLETLLGYIPSPLHVTQSGNTNKPLDTKPVLLPSRGSDMG